MSELFIVATPIGNLKDITLRAVDVLKSVDIIACEDTRTSKALCNHYEIATRLISYHKYSENERTGLILNYLKEGKKIALITDAGTPLISDPGNILVKNTKENGFKVTPIVGASAIIALLQSVSRVDEDFKFIGFLPKIEKQILEIFTSNRCENLVFYESPKRLLKTLKILADNGFSGEISVGRELTKKFEEIITLNIKESLKYWENKNEIKGEIVCLLHKMPVVASSDMILEDIVFLKKFNISNKNIAEILSKFKGYNKNKTYELGLDK